MFELCATFGSQRLSDRQSIMKIFSFFFEILPLVGFFIGFHYYGIYAAGMVSVVTGIFVLAISWYRNKRLSLFPVYLILFSAVFTFAAIFFDASVFIKIQPTITNGFFALILLGGLCFGRPMMQVFFCQQFNLTRDTWIKLTYRWGCFFLILAIANEIVWRNNPESAWVSYKTFIVAPMSLLFMLCQLPLTLRGQDKTSKEK